MTIKDLRKAIEGLSDYMEVRAQDVVLPDTFGMDPHMVSVQTLNEDMRPVNDGEPGTKVLIFTFDVES